MKCKACKKRNKEVVLTSCFHTFCRECMNQNIKDRKRRCFVCSKKVTKDQIKTLYLD